MGILWIILIGAAAGIVARLLAPGPNNPSGFILTVSSVRFWEIMRGSPQPSAKLI